MKKIIVRLTLLLFVFVVIACKPKTNEDTKLLPVRAITLSPQSISESVTLSGPVSAVKSAVVFPDAAGVLESIRVPIGGKLQKNEIIAYINASSAGSTYLRTPVRSPIAGELADIPVELGSSVSRQTMIAQVVDNSNLQLRATVTEGYAKQIAEGTQGKLTLSLLDEEDNTYDVQVYSVNNTFLDQTRMVNVQVRVNDVNPRVKSGMYGKLVLILETRENVLVVPKNSILQRFYNSSFVDGVFTLTKQGSDYISIFKPVTYGIEAIDRVQIMGDFSFGDVIVSDGQNSLADNNKVFLFELDGKRQNIQTTNEDTKDTKEKK